MNQMVYRVGPNDTITFVDAAWSAFASQNGMASPAPEAVLGTSLWKHIADLTTRHLYKQLADKVRQTRKPLTLPFRCDAPGKRRHMELHITPVAESELEFRSVLLRETKRSPIQSPPSKTSRSSKPMLMCVWCKRVKTSDWHEIEHAIRDSKLFAKAVLPLLSHVACPDCASRSPASGTVIFD